MPNYQNIADQLKAAALRYQALNEAAQALDTLGSFESAADDAKRRMTAARAEEATAVSDLAVAASNLAKAREQAIEIVADADDTAAEIKQGAADAAELVVNDAMGKAAALVSSAQSQADTLLQEAATRAETSLGEAEENEAKRDALASEVTAKQAELLVLNDKIAAARAQIAKLLGE